MSESTSPSRAKNSFYNLITGTAGQLVTLVFGFVLRMVFIRELGVSYLGITGLFSNILSLLSLTELGLGAAIVFHMYKAISEEDGHKIYLLMKFYRMAFRVIGLSILILGFLVLPFIPKLINEPPTFINVYLVFLMFLLQNTSSYLFFAYKRSLLTAYQQTYIINLIGLWCTVGTNLVQIATLIIFKNYWVYLCILITSSILNNILVARKCGKIYPFIKIERNEKLSKTEVKEILQNCYSLSIYNLSFIVTNSMDNIILSKLLGLAAVGLYSNYLMITSNLKLLLDRFLQSTSAGIGNLHASGGSGEHAFFIYKVMNFLAFFLFGTASTAVFTLANPFISLWIGKQFVLSGGFVIMISLDLYLYGIQQNNGIHRNAMGLFKQARYRPLVSALLNVVLSVVLVNRWGITGVIAGTVISNALTYTWYDPYVICRYGFHCSVRQYYLKNILYFGITLLSAAVSYCLGRMIPLPGLPGFILSACIAIAVPILFFTVCFFATDEFKYLFKQLLNLIKNNNKKNGI